MNVHLKHLRPWAGPSSDANQQSSAGTMLSYTSCKCGALVFCMVKLLVGGAQGERDVCVSAMIMEDTMLLRGTRSLYILAKVSPHGSGELMAPIHFVQQSSVQPRLACCEIMSMRRVSDSLYCYFSFLNKK